ncbi:MAG: AmmeMemoRadiSam system radical SAM enzyme [Deltaproteobacteria bacterium]|nr:AmmeMemoRadiSam system radical SAM enzyme [Deltaproteobacteria bacterium]
MKPGIATTVLMCHAPIVIPEIAGRRARLVRRSSEAMREAAAHLVAARPDVIIVLSPHAPRLESAFGVMDGKELSGDFRQFGCPWIGVRAPNDAKARDLIFQSARGGGGIAIEPLRAGALDHGAMVPMWFLANAGWNGRTVVVSFPYSPKHEECRAMGRAIADAARRAGERWAILASGDMSHRLTPDAPSGYHPEAKKFDRAFSENLAAGRFDAAVSIDPALRDLAAEDVVDSVEIAAAATGFSASGTRVLSYEGPFGVGYLIAILHAEGTPSRMIPDESADRENRSAPGLHRKLLDSAREAIRKHLNKAAPAPDATADAAPSATPNATTEPCEAKDAHLARGVFVTLWTKSAGGQKALRGCIGRHARLYDTLPEEIADCAVSSATQDPRFSPVTLQELAGLSIEIALLEKPERVSDLSLLDPATYGVIVKSGWRQATLLPGIEGIETVEDQLLAVTKKAGIKPDDPLTVFRFPVRKIAESPPELHPGKWWHKAKDGRFRCDLCPRGCTLKPGQPGFCYVRVGTENGIALTTYGRSSGFCIDPIEKKPLNHFYPGTSVLSFGTAGCNLGCKFCQNWDISKARSDDRLAAAASPERIARAAKDHGCSSVAFTYNDPVIFAEYAIDTAIECRKLGLHPVAVTAGYITAQARPEFYAAMDAANVDLKGFTEDFYRHYSMAHLQPVLDTLEYVAKHTNVWLEITTLLIPGANDSPEETDAMTKWLRDHVGPEVPLHFTAFHPDYKLVDRPATPSETLTRAREIALKNGLRYVYTGNVHDPAGSSTYCPSCGARVIERDWYRLGEYAVKDGCCAKCHHKISGHFQNQPGHWGAKRQSVEI